MTDHARERTLLQERRGGQRVPPGRGLARAQQAGHRAGPKDILQQALGLRGVRGGPPRELLVAHGEDAGHGPAQAPTRDLLADEALLAVGAAEDLVAAQEVDEGVDADVPDQRGVEVVGAAELQPVAGRELDALLFTLTGRPMHDPEPRPAEATGTRAGPRGARASARTAASPAAMAALPATPIDAGPADVGALVGALIHVHFLRVLEFGARLGVAPTARDRPVQMFLALPLLLPALAGVLGTPLPSDPRAGFDAQVQRRWIEYVDHLGELIPRAVVENLLATLVPRVVKASSA